MNVEQSCCGRPKWTTDSILVATQQSKVGMNDYYHNMNPPLLFFYYNIIHVFLGFFFLAMFCFRIGYHQTKRRRVGANKILIGWVL